MDESVLKGNTAIFKCHIPSFVSDYVYVVSWLQDDNNEIVTKDDQYGALNESYVPLCALSLWPLVPRIRKRIVDGKKVFIPKIFLVLDM